MSLSCPACARLSYRQRRTTSLPQVLADSFGLGQKNLKLSPLASQARRSVEPHHKPYSTNSTAPDTVEEDDTWAEAYASVVWEAESLPTDRDAVNVPIETLTPEQPKKGSIRTSRRVQVPKSHLPPAIQRQERLLRERTAASELETAIARFRGWRKTFARFILPGQDVPEALSGSYSRPWFRAADWLLERGTLASMRASWNRVDMDKRRESWPVVMLSTMLFSPDMTLQVLKATLDPMPPAYAIEDILRFLASRFQSAHYASQQERAEKTEEMLDFLGKVLREMPRNHVVVPQSTLGRFARSFPPDEAYRLYQLLQTVGFRAHVNTALQITSVLASSSRHKTVAFGMLQDLMNDGGDLNDPRYASVITSLLHCRENGDGWSTSDVPPFSPKVALQWLLEKGFKPNHIAVTAFLYSLCRRGEVEEAIRLALLFDESGVKLDGQAFATVFHGAKMSLDVGNVVAAFDVAKAANVPLRTVLNNALHAVFFFGYMESERHAPTSFRAPPLFNPMLRLYANAFQLADLQRLIPDSLHSFIVDEDSSGAHDEDKRSSRWRFNDTIVPAVEKLFSGIQGATQRPDWQTLSTMLRAYIKSLRKPKDVIAYYSFFKSRLEADATLAGFMRSHNGSLVHDALLLSMSNLGVSSTQQLKVFGDMLKDHIMDVPTPAASASHSSSSGPGPGPIQPQPTVFTFTILLHSLLSRGQRELADQVVQVMHENGVKPNLVTWNTMIKGYASMQDVRGTVQTLQALEARGYRPDVHTFRAFRKLKNQRRALKMMDNIIERNKKDLAVAEGGYTVEQDV